MKPIARYLLAGCLIFLQWSTPVQSLAQQEESLPTIGQQIPGFSFENLYSYQTRTASATGLRGKWLVLEFWAPFCTTCIKQFPTINEIHNKLKGELNWIMIGVVDNQYNKDTREFYTRVKSKMQLGMPYTYDSTLYKKWKVHGIPTILIVDPNGIVRYQTNGEDITVEKMKMLVENKPVTFSTGRSARPSFDPNAVQPETISQSKLTRWNGEAQSSGSRIVLGDKTKLEKETYSASMVSLKSLYSVAYIGRSFWLISDSLYTKVFPSPILQLKDSSNFKSDFKTGEGLYNYFVKLGSAPSSSEEVMKVLQEDLQRSFGYVASIEERSVPVYKLVEGPGAANKLNTKGGPQRLPDGNSMLGFSASNFPKSRLLPMLTFYLESEEELLPFFEQIPTVPQYIDVDVDGDLTTLDGVRNAIKKYDLQIIKTTAIMKVIVIRDPQ